MRDIKRKNHSTTDEGFPILDLLFAIKVGGWKKVSPLQGREKGVIEVVMSKNLGGPSLPPLDFSTTPVVVQAVF